ncbi:MULTISPECIES: hypothetical protein [Comamonas]|jgi:uncharacterized membrane protein|uniref:hypothetical protein n=1 Tax=Comamonas TaxID=283 RepID=UPI0012C0EB7B|nr:MULTISPECIES: hypothetical protein [Comamonas]MDR3064471.1 hypothetical protein [Comamonas sp.]MEB5964966.1 hypothetical protein [Comamonas testosteroni]MPS94343.1 hypothetical protein [Comamonas sp.]
MYLETAIALLALLLALLCRPWRMLGSRAGPGGKRDPVLSPLMTPLLAILVLLPWVWALPALHKMPLQLHWSGAPLVLLLIGWPLAVPVLIATSAMAFALAPALGLQDALGLAVWQGLVPATLAMLWGAAVRRWCWHNIFVFIFLRGFLGTVVCVFIASLLGQWAGHVLPNVNDELSHMARWLMAWSDGVTTGMLTAVFVVFRPHWVATWSDAIYLQPPGGPES